MQEDVPPLDEIRVVEVNRENLNSIWPHLLLAIRDATLIGIDLELSGLGNTGNKKEIEVRYLNMREAANTRAILSMGLAIFIRHAEEGRNTRYKCQVYNILCLSSQPFTLEPDALQFLSRHSFDFNRLVRLGVPYQNASQSTKQCLLRPLFIELLSSCVPMAFHNGLVDLIFLYAHFYTTLPDTCAQFISDLADLFPTESPLVDSKYLAEYDSRMPSSYLDQRENRVECLAGRVHITCSFSYAFPIPPDGVETTPCPLPHNFPNHAILPNLNEVFCKQFANHGFCRQVACTKEHNVDLILDAQFLKQQKERKRRKRRFDYSEKNEEEEVGPTSTPIPAGDIPRLEVTGRHRAGVDAFMTGFAVLCQQRMAFHRDGKLETEKVNRLPLSGKDRPLVVERSLFVEPSQKHRDQFMLIKAGRKKTQMIREAISGSTEAAVVL